jgi:predicted GIY-YIG superfamily endonuclease
MKQTNSTFVPLKNCPCVYTLKLQGDDPVEFYVYVGSCYNLNQRLAQHMSGVGARFTREHSIIDIISVQMIDGDAITAENERTLELIEQYGSERVRGGKYLSG